MPRPARGYRLRELPGGIQQVRFTHAGKRYEISTEEYELDRAEAKARQIYAAVISGRWTPGVNLAAPGARVSEVGMMWIEAIEPMVEGTTARQYSYYVTAHWQPHFVELEAFTRPPMIPSYVRARLKSVRRKTLQKELSAMRGFLAWCKEIGHLPELIVVPKLAVKSPGTPDARRKHKAVPVELSQADVAAILANLPEWSPGGPTSKPFAIKDYFVALYETGLRPVTIEKLEPRDLRAGELAIRDEIDKARFGRSVPLTMAAREALERQAGPGGLIFGRKDRAPYLRAAAILAGKAGVSPYDLRHARATHLMEASGNNIMGVGFLLGHTQATTTNRYARQTHRAAVSVLEQSHGQAGTQAQGGEAGRLHSAGAPEVRAMVPGMLGADREGSRSVANAVLEGAGYNRSHRPDIEGRLAGGDQPDGALPPMQPAQGGHDRLGVEAARSDHGHPNGARDHRHHPPEGPGGVENVSGTTGNGAVRKEGVERPGWHRRRELTARGEDWRPHQPEGISRQPEHVSWSAMIRRCTNPKDPSWKHYGGRGIKVCEAWLSSFEAFVADMDLRPGPDYSIDRYPNPDGNYEPGNCRWATRAEQTANRSVLGTGGNNDGAKEGNRTPTGVTPQEPESSQSHETTLCWGWDERHGTSVIPLGASTSWVSSPDKFDLAAAMARVLGRAS